MNLSLWDLIVVNLQGGGRVVLGSLSAAGSLGFSNARNSVFSTPTSWFLCAVAAKQGENQLPKQAHEGFCSEK